MPGVLNNLYPPIIDTYMPAFINTNSCRVYFSISKYNTYQEIRQNAQVTIRNQNSNSSALSRTLYPVGIKLCNIFIDNAIENDNKYYIEISPNDLEGGEFQIGEYYKIQIRFTSSSIQPPVNSSAIDSWLAQYTDYFSEWSRVCLVRGISQPIISLRHFSTSGENSSMIVTSDVVWFSGEVIFENPLETETLEKYRIKLFDSENKLIEDSEDIFTSDYNNPNEIGYSINRILSDGEVYFAKIKITTRNGYEEEKTYRFMALQTGTETLDADLVVGADEEAGCSIVKLISKEILPFSGTIAIRRSSNRDNFSKWEDVHVVNINTIEPLNYTWKDFTIESGVWYKYCAQRINDLGQRGIVLYGMNPILVLFEDMFLNADNKQLRIQFNPQISSFKRNIAETKTDTIGSKYSFIKRNGFMDYKSFQISGLISFLEDYEEMFASELDLYGNEESVSLYKNYNNESNIEPYNDYIKEREFRNKVIDFLYKDNIKLLRTLTEGNILIKLMDINLTPETVLNRQVYSFSAMAYEIDDYSIENINKYNIQTIEKKMESSTYFNRTHTGQIIVDTNESNATIHKILKDKYNNLAPANHTCEFLYLSYLKLEFNSPPYLIKDWGNGTVARVNNVTSENNIYLGYLVYINGKPIIVNKEGIYTLNGDNIEITSIDVINANVTVDYTVNYTLFKNIESQPTILVYDRKVGQLWGEFDYKDSLIAKLWNKYNYKNETSYQKLISIIGLNVEAAEGSVIWIKESKDSYFNKHILTNTESLQIFDDEIIIEDFYFGGVHLYPASKEDLLREELPDNKFYNTNIKVKYSSLITKPVKNYVYIIGQEKKIYYNNDWFAFNDDNDVLCPVDGLVDYICDLTRGEF